MILRVSLGFTKLSDPHLATFGQRIVDQLTGNPTYPTPPVALAVLTTSVDDFLAAIVAAYTGGVLATATKNALRDTLLDQLRKTAAYVQICANSDLEKLLSSGFEPVSTNRTRYPLPQPAIAQVRNGPTTQLVVTVNTIPNAKAWEARAKTSDGDWGPSTFSTDSRRITLGGLTPGEEYTIEVRAVGGSTGLSPWSDPTTHMSM